MTYFRGFVHARGTVIHWSYVAFPLLRLLLLANSLLFTCFTSFDSLLSLIKNGIFVFLTLYISIYVLVSMSWGRFLYLPLSILLDINFCSIYFPLFFVFYCLNSNLIIKLFKRKSSWSFDMHLIKIGPPRFDFVVTYPPLTSFSPFTRSPRFS